jgi:hypothetical protein
MVRIHCAGHLIDDVFLYYFLAKDEEREMLNIKSWKVNSMEKCSYTCYLKKKFVLEFLLL